MISNAMGRNGGLPDLAQRRENRMNRIGTSAPHTFCVGGQTPPFRLQIAIQEIPDLCATAIINTPRRHTSAPDACLRAAPVSRRALPTTAFALILRCNKKCMRLIHSSGRRSSQVIRTTTTKRRKAKRRRAHASQSCEAQDATIQESLTWPPLD
jgi:hypothetical protein